MPPGWSVATPWRCPHPGSGPVVPGRGHGGWAIRAGGNPGSADQESAAAGPVGVWIVAAPVVAARIVVVGDRRATPADTPKNAGVHRVPRHDGTPSGRGATVGRVAWRHPDAAHRWSAVRAWPAAVSAVPAVSAHSAEAASGRPHTAAGRATVGVAAVVGVRTVAARADSTADSPRRIHVDVRVRARIGPGRRCDRRPAGRRSPDRRRWLMSIPGPLTSGCAVMASPTVRTVHRARCPADRWGSDGGLPRAGQRGERRSRRRCPLATTVVASLRHATSCVLPPPGTRVVGGAPLGTRQR